jgi:tRNA (guanine-N7-)-methyltransferase
MTDSQKRALAELWPRYGVTLGDVALRLADCFNHPAPLHLEIGFGNGEALAAMALAHPENNYLGIEVHRPGVAALLKRAHETGLTNLRAVVGDVTEMLPRVPDETLSAVYVFFPDPWPKLRHRKRRLVQETFSKELARVLKPGGVVFLATDWKNYAEQMVKVFSANAAFKNAAGEGGYSARTRLRPLTKFESRGRKLGHGVYDLNFQKR